MKAFFMEDVGRDRLLLQPESDAEREFLNTLGEQLVKSALPLEVKRPIVVEYQNTAVGSLPLVRV